MLLIGEVARIVGQLESVAKLAVIAAVRLQHAATRDELSFNEAAFVALEGCLFHLRDYIGVSDDNALDRDEFVDVRRVQVSDAVVFAEAEGTDLYDWLHTCGICSWHNLGATLTHITLSGVA
jgi:hypothetical protein